ncbi:hypothetical protein RDI58_020136 [Solanum bulbocastanum]|uniref:DUF4216 domain-containing protein n=1 Tax=Solanum bulbocastanum TaxID=147425 RepID=A0AAN8T853_SOLBU
MPELNVPLSYNKTKSMVKNLGLHYEKIDACPNDCMLFRNDHKDDEFCHTCRASRYIKNPEVDRDVQPSKKSHRVSAKTLRHFPLIPRLKRLFMCSKMADSLRWHDEKRSKDGKLRHPADGQAWKDFDRLHSVFAQDSRNVRLGLASDGFNPFRTMSISHSTWPRTKFAKACFSMTNREKLVFYGVLKTAKLPDGSASNISRCVQLDERKLSGYKTHDAHFILHYLLPMPIKSILPEHVAIPLIRLCSFFQQTESLFPQKGCPLGARKTDPFILDKKSLSQAYAYLLGNCDEIQEYIREHEQEVNNHPRRSKWSKAKDHCQNFSQWFETRALQEDVPDLIKKLSRGPNFVTKRYFGYLINGYRFHIRQRDARRKTQNSGVTVVASTTSFASSKDKNPIAANLTYYGRIVDIVELDYYSHFKVVLFKCDWYEVEKDIYGLTYVYFNKRCSQEEPFVLASQVHQCFYVQDPYDQNRHYVMKTVSRDLFNMSDEFESDLAQSYENELSEHLMGPSIPEDDGEVTLVRNDVPETVIDVPSEEFVTQQLEVEYEKEFEDESEEEFEDESEEKCEDWSENEHEDDSEDESEDESED